MNIAEKVIYIVKGMEGIGGIATDEEFLNEFEFRLQALKQGHKLIIDSVSHRRELLPEFLMHDLDGKIITSVIGSADVTKEWNEYLGNFG